MRRCLFLLTAAALLLPQMALGQMFGQPSYGMFGYRTMGKTLYPGTANFGHGIQTGPGGNVLYVGRIDGSAAFATPWRRIQPETLWQVTGVPPGVPLTPRMIPIDANNVNATAAGTIPSLAPPTPETEMPELAPPVEPVPAPEQGSLPATEAPALPLQPTGNGEQGPASATGNVAPAVSNVTIPRATTQTVFSLAGMQPFVRSPQFSERLTRIARDRGMLAGAGIDVYMTSGIAILQGAVRTTHDRELLANVVGLEPGVRQVYNRLIPRRGAD